MPVYVCDVCSKSYSYKRNLKRHKTEKHGNMEYWNCIEANCSPKFIRRSYLSKHLISRHGYSSLRGRELACTAPRGDRVRPTYYEDISEDESVFELIDDMQRIRSHDETIADFELGYFDDITLGNLEDAAIVSDIVNGGNFSDYDAAIFSDIANGGKSSDNDAAIVSDIANGGNSSDDDAAIVSDIVDGGNSSDCEAAIVSDKANGGNFDSDCEAASVGDNSVNGGNVLINDHVEDEVVDRYNIESYSDVSQDGFSTDDSWNVSDSEEDYGVIIIDSDDDTALVPSTLMTRTQTFVFTIRRETQYVDGHEMNAIFTMERDYYENWN